MALLMRNIFLKPVDRPIDGVIKADDETSLRTELEEYVITNEIALRLEQFLQAYNNYTTANGVWISGFFGSGKSHLLKMLAYPRFYHSRLAADPESEEEAAAVVEPETNEQADLAAPAPMVSAPVPQNSGPRAGHYVFAENRKGVSFDKLFGPYLKGATSIVVTDPYIRIYYQIRNMMELLETILRKKAPEDQVIVELITCPDEGGIGVQREKLDAMAIAFEGTGLTFKWSFDGTGTAHARHIITNTGWKICLDRGLDIFQKYPMNEALSLANRMQEQRAVKQFEVTFVRAE